MTLGLNTEFDNLYNFRSIDYILMGGKRGSGKSLTCSNIANHTVNNEKKKALYFTIEMDAREVLQRSCSIDTKVPFFKVRNKNLSEPEWEKIVKWWASRYEDSEEHVKAYLQHHDFARFHTAVSRHPLVSAYVDIIYDPSLTLGRIRAEVEKRAADDDIGVIIVDYINQVKRGYGASEDKQFDWKDQIFISKALKQLAQDFKVPVFSPYQIDKEGEARFAKGILDSADGAMILNAHKKEDAAITFTITKMRGQNDEFEFTSAVDWNTLTIGPNSAEKPVEELKPKFGKAKKPGESIYDDAEDPPF
jgi:replicative DNA helicase